jgi:hypothetical protein
VVAQRDISTGGIFLRLLKCIGVVMPQVTTRRAIAAKLAQSGVEPGIIAEALMMPQAELQEWLQIKPNPVRALPGWTEDVWPMMKAFTLSRQQGIVLAMLLEQKLCSLDALREAISPASHTVAIANTILGRLRRRMRPFGITIRNQKYLGYFLSIADKRAVRALLKERAF